MYIDLSILSGKIKFVHLLACLLINHNNKNKLGLSCAKLRLNRASMLRLPLDKDCIKLILISMGLQDASMQL